MAPERSAWRASAFTSARLKGAFGARETLNWLGASAAAVLESAAKADWPSANPETSAAVRMRERFMIFPFFVR
jgi:hypothetical protein